MNWKFLPATAKTKRVEKTKIVYKPYLSYTVNLHQAVPTSPSTNQGAPLPRDHESPRGGVVYLHLHTDMLSSVLALLESEKRVFVELREPIAVCDDIDPCKPWTHHLTTDEEL